MGDEPKRQSGAQTVDRALSLLRLVAGAPPDGLRLSDLAEAGGYDRATAHRLLNSLVNHGFVDQDEDSKRYSLGLEFFTLAAAASNRHDVAGFARETLKRIAEETGDSVMLCLRSGLNFVCIDVEMGSFPIKALPMDIGSHRPVGAGASGIAMLAGIPDFEVDAALAKVAARLAGVPGQDPDTIRRNVAACRAAGYALAPEDPEGRILGLSVGMTNRRNRSVGTLTLTGIAERFGAERLGDLSRILTAGARAIDDAMWRMPDDERHRSQWADRTAKRGVKSTRAKTTT